LSAVGRCDDGCGVRAADFGSCRSVDDDGTAANAGLAQAGKADGDGPADVGAADDAAADVAGPADAGAADDAAADAAGSADAGAADVAAAAVEAADGDMSEPIGAGGVVSCRPAA